MPPDFPKPDPAVQKLLNEGLLDRGLSSGVHVLKDPRWERIMRAGDDKTSHVRCEGKIIGRIVSIAEGYRWSVGLSLATSDELERGLAPTFDDALAVANKLVDAFDAADRLSGGSPPLCGKCGLFLRLHTEEGCQGVKPTL